MRNSLITAAASIRPWFVLVPVLCTSRGARGLLPGALGNRKHTCGKSRGSFDASGMAFHSHLFVLPLIRSVIMR